VPDSGSEGSKLKPLLGTDDAVVDDKGRILISKKKRERLGDNFSIALGDVGCLVAYPEATWNAMVDEIMTYESINQGRQQYTRLVLGTAEDELTCDAQGRVVVPAKLRKLAKLEKEVKIVGCGDRLEIWAVDEWEKYDGNETSYGQQRREAIQKAFNEMKGR